ncbi:MAG: pentapeptide repeat-containing protein [Cyanobacteria bacterium P01_F01_bin.53]
MYRFKATKRGLAQPKNPLPGGYGTRANRSRLRKLAIGAAWLGSTFSVVVVALYIALTVETALKDTSWNTPKELGGSISDYVFPWETRHDLIESLKDSVILDSLDSVSIITALTLFVLVGRREEERQAHYIAWFMLDAAHNRETSYARYNALQDLNSEGLSLKGLDAPKTDLAEIQLEGADLQQATLDEVKLQKANLRKANLSFASLQQAHLRSTILERTSLFNANLEDAVLGGANLGWADLSNANLKNADFFDANFVGTNLSEANLEGASFKKARNLTTKQIKKAENWDKAEYDDDFYYQLFPDNKKKISNILSSS